jgi:hypothetical protein
MAGYRLVVTLAARQEDSKNTHDFLLKFGVLSVSPGVVIA